MATIYKRSVKHFTNIKVDKNREIPNATLPSDIAEQSGQIDSFDSVGESVAEVREESRSIRKHDMDSPSVSIKEEKVVVEKADDKSPKIFKTSRTAKNKVGNNVEEHKKAVRKKKMANGEESVVAIKNPLTNEEKEILKKREAKSASHKKTRAEGKAFEEAVIRGCQYYEREGRAFISKVPESRKVVGRTGGRASMMICVNDTKAHPDFMGSVAPDGKCFVMEAKHSSKEPMAYARVTEHQLDILKKHDKCGADCYIIIAFSRETQSKVPFDFGEYAGVAYLLPLDMWVNMSKYIGRKSIYLHDCAENEAVKSHRVRYEYDEEGKEIVYFLDKFEG